MKNNNFLYLFIINTVWVSALIGFNSAAIAAPASEASCSAYLVAEATTGDLLESLNPDEARPPASMAKLMTAYVILKKIKEGSLNLEDQVNISADASKIGGSQVYLKQGEVFTVNELLNALLIQSANDAALALAQHISGSRDSFVEEMNQAASELGMKHAEFHSPHGLPPGKDQLEDHLSPNDFLILARALIVNYPEILGITKKDVETFRNGTFEMRNHNGLLRTFEGTDGLKTGFYNEAGFCVTATAQRKGIRLIAVLMGCPTRKIRDDLAAQLLSKSFSKFKTVVLTKAGDPVADVKVTKGVKTNVSLLTKDAVSASSKVGEEQKIEKKVKACELTAPVSKGTLCGTVEFIKDSQILGSSQLIVSEDIAEAGITQRLLNLIGW